MVEREGGGSSEGDSDREDSIEKLRGSLDVDVDGTGLCIAGASRSVEVDFGGFFLRKGILILVVDAEALLAIERG
jgi:hypothetical protein